VRGTWRGDSFNGDPEGYGKQDTGNGRLFPLGPRFWGTWRDAPFLGLLREGKNFFI
jgi:hypothetical protein